MQMGNRGALETALGCAKMADVLLCEIKAALSKSLVVGSRPLLFPPPCTSRELELRVPYQLKTTTEQLQNDILHQLPLQVAGNVRFGCNAVIVR